MDTTVLGVQAIAPPPPPAELTAEAVREWGAAAVKQQTVVLLTFDKDAKDLVWLGVMAERVRSVTLGVLSEALAAAGPSDEAVAALEEALGEAVDGSVKNYGMISIAAIERVPMVASKQFAEFLENQQKEGVKSVEVNRCEQMI